MDNPTLDVQVLSGDLRAALANVKRAINPRSSLPILTYGMVETDNGRLTLRGTNLEVAISQTISAKVAGEGRAVIPVHQLAASLPAKPAGPVRITANGQDVSVTLPGGAVLNYHTEAPEDYPSPVRPPDREPDAYWAGQELARAASVVARAAAPDQERPILAGVQVEFGEGRATMAAADSFRLALYHLEAGATGPKRSIIVPAASLRILAQLIGRPAKLAVDNEPVSMWILEERSQVVFSSGPWVLVSQLVKGVFPDYRQIIPHTSTAHVIPTGELLNAVKVMRPMAKQANGILRFASTDQKPGTLGVSAVASGEGEGVVWVRTDSPLPYRFALNSKYALDALETIGTDRLILGLNGGPSSPVTIQPTDGELLTWVIMPMYVAD
ncbi:MAG: DNA polymerase III subunit beta [bacterium]